MRFDDWPEEWHAWVRMTPIERFRQSEEIFAQYLAMGGSLDPDPEGNLHRLARALEALQADRIAVPAFEPDLLRRGHAVHFRCRAPGVDGLRIDIMTKLRDLADFESLWARRTMIGDDKGMEVALLSVPDLVQAKKTQRSKDWPVIEALVEIHYLENGNTPRPEWTRFWLLESRSAESLIDLTGTNRTAKPG